MLKLMKLENRIVLDGAALAAVAEAVDHADDGGATHEGDAYAGEPAEIGHFSDASAGAAALLAGPDVDSEPVDVVLIADSLPDPDALAAAADADARVIIYDAENDSAEAVVDRVVSLSEDLNRPVGSVTLLSHGDDGGFTMGNEAVTAETVDQFSSSWRALNGVMAEDGRIYLFGCSAGGRGDGQALLDGLASATGADIFASDDITGHGGDWDLEVAADGSTPDVVPPLDTELLGDYAGVLAAPSAANGDVTLDEDTTYAFTVADFNFSDPDGDPLAKIQITRLESAGSLELNGVELQQSDEVSRADIEAGNLTFTPNPNANGTGYADFGFKVHDGGAYSVDSYTMTVNVSPVQDPPTALDNTVTTEEDTNYVFNRNDFLFNDVDVNAGDSLVQVRITQSPTAGSLQLNGVPLAAGDEIPVAEIVARHLMFVPASDANGAGYATFRFEVSDGKDYSVNDYAMTVDVTPVNDLPTAENKTITMDEDTSYTLGIDDFGFSDVDAGDTLTTVRIAQIQTAGMLTLDGVDVGPNEEISRADIEAGKLIFTPEDDANGDEYATFRFKVSDGTAFSESAYTIQFNVNPINDPPTAVDGTVTTSQNTPYTFELADFSFNDVDEGDSFDKVQISRIETAGSLQLDGAEVALNQEIDAVDIAAGNLTFVPAENASGEGYAVFGFKVHDGTVYSDDDYTMTVNVTVGNIPPRGNDTTITLDEDTTHTLTAADFGFTDPDGGSFERVKVTQLVTAGSLTLDGNPVGLNQEIELADIEAGKLTFSPNPDANGEAYATVKFKVHDGTDYSIDPNVLTFDVTPVQDAPTSIDNTVVAFEVDPETLNPGYRFQVQDFIFNDVDVTDEMDRVQISDIQMPEGATLTLNGDAVADGAEIPVADIVAGNLVFTPVEYKHGDDYAEFTFKVHDGKEYSVDGYTMTIDVAPVNQRPEGPAIPVSLDEDTSYTFTLEDFDYEDFDDDDLQEIWVTKTVSAGSLTLDGREVQLFDRISRAEIEAGGLVFTPNENAYGQINHPVNQYEYADFQFRYNDGVRYSAEAYLMPIIVNPVNDPPTSEDNTVGTVENEGYAFALSDFDFEDMENDPFRTVQITTPPDRGTLTLNGASVASGSDIPVDSIRAGQLVYTPAADSWGDDFDSFQFKVSDNGKPAPAYSVADYTMTIDVERGNLPPGIPGTFTATFREGDVPVHVTEAGAVIEDEDSQQLQSLTAVIQNLKVDDELRIGNDSAVNGISIDGTSIVATYNPDTGTLELTGVDTIENYQNVLRQITFFNPSENPDDTNRLIEFNVVDDRGAQSNPPAKCSLTVIPVNDEPVNLYNGQEAFPDTLFTPENEGLTFNEINGNRLSIKDIDAFGYNDAGEPVDKDVQVTLTVDHSTITVSSHVPGLDIQSNGTERVVLTGTVSEVNAALQEVRYDPTPDFRGEAHLTIQTNDLGATGEGGPQTDTDLIRIFVGNPPPHRGFEPTPVEGALGLIGVPRPPGLGGEPLSAGPVTFPGDVLDTGRVSSFRALRGLADACGQEELYECCTLEEALKIGCRFAPAYNPDARVCNVTWDYLSNTLGWEKPFIERIDGEYFNEELDLFNRLFMGDEGDPGFTHRPGTFAEAFGAEEEEAFARLNRDEEHDIYSQLSMREAGGQTFNDVGPGELKEAFFEGREAFDRPARWSNTGDTENC